MKKILPAFGGPVSAFGGSFVMISLLSLSSFAQEVEMADRLRTDGKIYVVVAVLVTILLGIIVYLIMIDRKISDVEKKLKK